MHDVVSDEAVVRRAARIFAYYRDTLDKVNQFQAVVASCLIIAIEEHREAHQQQQEENPAQVRLRQKREREQAEEETRFESSIAHLPPEEAEERRRAWKRMRVEGVSRKHSLLLFQQEDAKAAQKLSEQGGEHVAFRVAPDVPVKDWSEDVVFD